MSKVGTKNSDESLRMSCKNLRTCKIRREEDSICQCQIVGFDIKLASDRLTHGIGKRSDLKSIPHRCRRLG